jgi:hypothetical protein
MSRNHPHERASTTGHFCSLSQSYGDLKKLQSMATKQSGKYGPYFHALLPWQWAMNNMSQGVIWRDISRAGDRIFTSRRRVKIL